MLNSKEWEELFTRKEWILEFIWINFSSYWIVDIRDGKDKPYDISTRGVSSFAPDFLKDDGQFDNRQYCICLYKTVLELSYNNFPDFLQHQFGSMESPLNWLRDFDELLKINEDFSLMKPSMKRFELMRKAISDECIFISFTGPEQTTDLSMDLYSVEEPAEVYHYVNKLLKGIEETDNYKKQISICKKYRATYLREVDNASESSVFIRIVDKLLDPRKEIVSKTREAEVWKGNGKALIEYHVLNNMPRDEEGRFIGSPCYATEARYICDRYLNNKGRRFKFETIQTGIGRFVRDFKSRIDAEDQEAQ